jgi:hypothetical protein
MNIDQISTEIVFLKGEIASLETQLQTTAEGSERIFLQQKILAKNNQITEYVKLLQSTGLKKSGFCFQRILLFVFSSCNFSYQVREEEENIDFGSGAKFEFLFIGAYGSFAVILNRFLRVWWSEGTKSIWSFFIFFPLQIHSDICTYALGFTYLSFLGTRVVPWLKRKNLLEATNLVLLVITVLLVLIYSELVVFNVTPAVE